MTQKLSNGFKFWIDILNSPVDLKFKTWDF